MKKQNLFPSFIIAIYFFSISAIFPSNFSWEKMEIPFSQRIEQITFNTKGDVFFTSYTHDPNITFSGWSKKIYRKENNSNEWQQIYDNSSLRYIFTDSSDIYIAVGSRIYKSADSGASWETLVDSLPVSFIHTIAKAPNGDLYFGANGTNYCSKNGGKSWQKLNLDYQTKSFFFLKNGIILAGQNTGYFPNPPSLIYRSADDGATWDSVLIAEKSYNWSFVENNKGEVFAATSEYDSTNGGVYKSVDFGKTWSQINNGLPSREVLSLAINSIGTLFAAVSDYGLFISTDDGNNWESLNEDDLFTNVNTLNIDRNDILYVGNAALEDTASIYYCQTITSVEENRQSLPSTFNLEQNYPNPFNPVTTINYRIPNMGYVELLIYNSLGEKIKILVDEIKSSGKHEFKFDASNLSSGIYYYELRFGNYKKVRKMLVLK
jgi:photosystem II stability/assembly factor-like uncharacterized protein